MLLWNSIQCGYLIHITDRGGQNFSTPVFFVCLFVFLNRLLFFFNFYLFIYLFMAVLGLRFCARAFSSCSEWGPLFIVVRGPLIIAASPVAEHRLHTRRLSSCGARAWLLRSMWDLPRPGLEPVSPALAGRLSPTAPPGKPPRFTEEEAEASYKAFQERTQPPSSLRAAI